MDSRRVPILMYHEISADPRSAPRLAVHPEAFARQLSYLEDHGYVPVTARRLACAMSGASAEADLPARPVVLTFDDGFADFHDVALPLLTRHGFTASVYVTSGWVAGELAGSAAPARMLSWPAIEELAAAQIEVGAHSLRHPQLDQLGPAELRIELADSRKMIEDRLGAEVTGLAYPFGYSNRQVRELAAEIGYGYACAVDNRLASEAAGAFALPRLTIGRATTMTNFGLAVEASRLPARFAGYRMLTAGWAPVRRARSALGQAAR